MSTNSLSPTGMPTSSVPTGMPTALEWGMYQTETSLMMLGTSLITLVGCSALIIAYSLNPLLRKKTYVQMVFYGALGDFVGAVSTVFGELKDDTPLCITQGILSNIFPLISVYWTVAITFLLYYIVIVGKPIEITRTMHGLVLILSILPTVLVYTTNRIGTPYGAGWCFIADNLDGSSPPWGSLFWTLAAFYGPIAISILIMIVLLVFINIHAMRMNKASAVSATNAKSTSVKKLWLYPAVVLTCWLIPAIYDIHDAIEPDNLYPYKDVLYGISVTLPLLQGFFTAVIFLTSTTVVRNQIAALLCCRQVNATMYTVHSQIGDNRKQSMADRFLSRGSAVGQRNSITENEAPQEAKRELKSPSLKSSLKRLSVVRVVPVVPNS